MTNYIPLTKIITDENGNQSVACSFVGTEMCRELHNAGCMKCPVFAAILKQLNTFESVYLEEEQENHGTAN